MWLTHGRNVRFYLLYVMDLRLCEKMIMLFVMKPFYKRFWSKSQLEVWCVLIFILQ